MSKHIDLIAVGALLLAFAVGTRVHDRLQVSFFPVRFMRMQTIKPIRIVPPVPPAAPRFPRLPHFPRV